MKGQRIILICLLLTIIFRMAIAQELCGTGSKLVPMNAAGVIDLQKIRDNIAGAAFTKQQGDTLIFPTVVHIIHNAGVGNISDSQIVDGLRIINEDFNRENADTSVTRSLFKPYATAVGFKFVLAKLDSNGDSTSGIVRIDTSIIPHPEPTSTDFDNCKQLSHWPADMYYNIWIVRSIQGGTLGYAQYPGTNFTYGGPWKTWGIVVRHNQWGTIGTSSADGRTGTHEVGHTFGLYHTFLSASNPDCGSVCDTTGDEVCDTPPNKYSSSCPPFINTCTNDTSGNSVYDTNVVDQIENFMSYNTCQNMLSEGQKVRMRGFIASFPTLIGLSTDSNLYATGIIDCPNPGAAFIATVTNDSVMIINISSTTGTASYYWDFGDSAGVSVEENPIYTYTNPGSYNACLIVEDNCGADTVCQIITISSTQVAIGSHLIGNNFSELQLHPNPCVEEIRFIYQLPARSNVTWEIFDYLGRLVMNGEIAEYNTGLYENTLSVNVLPDGAYVFKLNCGDQSLQENFIKLMQ